MTWHHVSWVSFCTFSCEGVWDLIVEVTVVEDVGLVEVYRGPAVPVEGVLNLNPGEEGGIDLSL